jgi:hypothetical protein
VPELQYSIFGSGAEKVQAQTIHKRKNFILSAFLLFGWLYGTVSFEVFNSRGVLGDDDSGSGF